MPLLIMADDFEYDDLEEQDEEQDEDDEDNLLRYYFYRGFKHLEIIQFLSKYHDITVSHSTLKRRLRVLGLKRRRPEYDIAEVRNAVRRLLDGPDSCRGYRSIWHTLQLNGLQVPRMVVQQVMKELDPEGARERGGHRLKRRVYHNLGPNNAWHCDGYDKLKPFGFPIHGCIDGWSRKILWLFVTRSNNLPDNIAMYYLEAVNEMNGCPLDLVTDRGTENGKMAGIHSFLRNDPNSHRYVHLPRNQRIEGWWSFFRKSHTDWWINFFKDLCDTMVVDMTNELEKECLWYCFASTIQASLNQVKEHWNTHYVRKSRFDTAKGRPDSLYYLPELNGGQNNLLIRVPGEDRCYAKNHLIENDEPNNYHQYFSYVMRVEEISRPKNWRESLTLYHRLIDYSRN